MFTDYRTAQPEFVQISIISICLDDYHSLLFVRNVDALVNVSRGNIIRLLHQALLLRCGSLLQVGSDLLVARAAVTKPEKDDDLAKQHTKGTCEKTGQNTENSRNNDEAEDTRHGAVQATVVEVVHVRRGRRREVVTGARKATFSPGTVAVVVVRTVMHRTRERRTTVAALGSSKSRLHSQHTGLGGSKQVAHTVEQKLSQAAGLSAALLPGHAVGSGLFHPGLGHVNVALTTMNQGNRNGIKGDGVAVEVENCETDFQQFDSLLRRGRQRHHLEGVAQRNRVGFFAIGFATLNGVDSGRWWWREDLVTVGQKQSIIDRKVQGLRPAC